MTLSFFRRPSTEVELPDLKPGELYRRPRRDRVAETATVLTLCADPVGIPHVRFNVAFDHVESGRLEGGTSSCGTLRCTRRNASGVRTILIVFGLSFTAYRILT